MKEPDNTRHTPRLFIDAELGEKMEVSPSSDQAHYLQHVMRMKPGAALRVFNGRDGEWLAHIGAVSKRSTMIKTERQLRIQQAEPDIWLCAAPIKKAHFDTMIEKATELGVAAIQPVLTARTQIREVNVARCRAIAIEAAEQSERLNIPDIREPISLGELATQWSNDRALIVCAEWGEAKPAAETFSGQKFSKAAILTGPEGGFAEEEMERLRKVPNAVFIRLGPRILRADTAALAALSLWQALSGDWK